MLLVDSGFGSDLSCIHCLFVDSNGVFCYLHMDVLELVVDLPEKH